MSTTAERMANKSLEHALGKGLMQPFANTNSGSRKLMYSVHVEQALPIMTDNPEPPTVGTGYEIRFGDLSSSIVKAEADFEVLAKIPKYTNIPNHHYLLIIRNLYTNELGVIERKSYTHIGETYGYLYNNKILDNLDIGYEVPKNDILRTSMAYDDYMNRCDGMDLLAGYISSDRNIEDGIVISKTGAEKLKSPLIKKVTVFIGENDIFLNLLGDNTGFKSFPDITEDVKDGILCAIRQEKTEECLYMQSVDRLHKMLMTDDKFTVEQTVLDIEIHSNKPSSLEERHTNSQVLYYYREHIRFIREIVDTVDSLISVYGNNMTYDLEKIYYNSKYELDDMPFAMDKKYDGTILKFYMLERSVPSVGDKVTNRYGGKGVISYIVEDDEMPLLDNGRRLDVYFNSCTCVNRLNQGQLDEVSLTFSGSRILDHINNSRISTIDAITEVYKFISLASSQEQADYFWDTLYDPSVTEEDREWFINNMIDDGKINLSTKPISESMTLDRLVQLYKEFPYVKQYSVVSKIYDSNGNPRYIKGRKRITAGNMYIYRLKQYAEDKFSATSLSSTNLVNENTKSKASKNYMSTCANTPIRFGEMEAGDERHMPTRVVVENLMIHSTSPQARRLLEAHIEGDPYEINIKLDGTCKSRSAQKAKVYLKAMGYAIKIYKIAKKKTRLFGPLVPPALPGERQRLFSYNHPDEVCESGESWLEKLKAKEAARQKRLFRKKLFSKVDHNKKE